jgi:hypothetical protein
MQVYNKIVLKQGSKSIFLGLLNGALSLTDIVTQLPDLYSGFSKPFKDAKASAKLTGKLLACVLAAGYPFTNQTISFVGFSLGCQVIKSCLKMLHKLGAAQMVHEVTLLGGATNCLDNPKNSQLWNSILSAQVAGQIKNVFTKRDLVLLLYSASEVDCAVGRSACFTEKSPAGRNF